MGMERESSGQGVEDNEPLLGGGGGDVVKDGESTHVLVAPDGAEPGRFTFLSGPRPRRDVVFSYLFYGAVIVTYVVGVFAIWNAEPDWSSLERFTRYNPESGQCERIQHAYVGSTPTHVSILGHHGRRDTEQSDRDMITLWEILVPILLTIGVVIPAGLAMLWLLLHYTRQVALTVLACVCAIPVVVGVVLSTICLSSKTSCSKATMGSLSGPAIFTLVLLFCVSFISLIQIFVVWKNRSRLDLAIQILKTALQALRQNLSLLLLNPILSVTAVAVNAPVCFFIWYAFFNGRVAPNFDAIKDPSFECSQATGAPCCEFQPKVWVIPYLIVAYVTLIWVMVIASQLQILVISGTISQWYFAPTGSSTVGTTKRAIRNAVGPSFGTACLSSLMIVISAILRSLLDRAGAKIGNGILSVFLRSCFSWLFQIFEFFTRFSTNFAAISGDSFCTAARATFELLKRNLLSTMVVESMAGCVLFGIILMVSIFDYLIVYGTMYFFVTPSTDSMYMLLMTDVCFVISIFVLMQIYGALSMVIDTVYICYAMDKDVGAVSKRDVHDVYMLLPPAASGDQAMLAVQRSEP